ncbi:UDP-2,3-diacylglucosamine hydrolase [Anatilimnocola aggregata]|uniref:UDP-2,3-diacylglucosamine hydrolase n=1 Tax=Anatilimnocola aggregata TaxID=2528021 RepID=A0A517Y6X8_9BACT|nr:UDP-2,3-diacylglucosamine diphosphatase [Anatilimnocola aggregata]QDU25983.1 UDP-2,3-diacylglucosamine hydrolase [Anatilimnocola aggregata]
MIARQARRRVRSIFLSDLHLGCRYSRAGELLALLDRHEPEYLYLVGDIIDGWRLKRRWHWQPEYSQLLQRIIELASRGVQIRYTPGNHDAFLRPFVNDFGFVEIADEFIHETATGQRLLVLHGDQFDTVEIRAQWLSVLGSVAYDTLLFAASGISRMQKLLGYEPTDLTGNLKRRVKQAVRFVSNFEERLARHARETGCDGVVCGHVHTPTAMQLHEVRYFNTGDWVENRSALIEYTDASLEILHLPAATTDCCPVTYSPDSTADDSAWQPKEPRFKGEQLVVHRPRIPVAV